MYTTSMCGPQALVAARLFWAPMALEVGAHDGKLDF